MRSICPLGILGEVMEVVFSLLLFFLSLLRLASLADFFISFSFSFSFSLSLSFICLASCFMSLSSSKFRKPTAWLPPPLDARDNPPELVNAACPPPEAASVGFEECSTGDLGESKLWLSRTELGEELPLLLISSLLLPLPLLLISSLILFIPPDSGREGLEEVFCFAQYL